MRLFSYSINPLPDSSEAIHLTSTGSLFCPVGLLTFFLFLYCLSFFIYIHPKLEFYHSFIFSNLMLQLK